MGIAISSCRGGKQGKYLTGKEEKTTNCDSTTKLAEASRSNLEELEHSPPSTRSFTKQQPVRLVSTLNKNNKFKSSAIIQQDSSSNIKPAAETSSTHLSYKQAVLAGVNNLNKKLAVVGKRASEPDPYYDKKLNKAHYLNFLKQHHSNILHHDHYSRFNHSRQLGKTHSVFFHTIRGDTASLRSESGQINLKIEVTTSRPGGEEGDQRSIDSEENKKKDQARGDSQQFRRKKLLTRSSNLQHKSSLSHQNTTESSKSKRSRRQHLSKSQSYSSTPTEGEEENENTSDELFEKSMSQTNDTRRPSSSQHVSNNQAKKQQRKYSAATAPPPAAAAASSRSESNHHQHTPNNNNNNSGSNRSSSNTSHYYHHHHHHHHIHHVHHAHRSVRLINGVTAASGVATTTTASSHHQQNSNSGHNNIDNSRENTLSPAMSIASLVNGEIIRNGASIFSHLYSQISNNACKVVTDDSAASLVSFSTNNSQKGSPRDKNKYDDSASNCQPVSHYSDLSNFDTLPAVESIDSVKCSITRLIKIKNALDEPSDLFSFITKHDLKKNLDYFLRVLENVLQDERKRLMSEDDVLSEVEPDTVPNEVRNWLSMTFTRSVSNMKRKMEDKPKFKSVAQAIRAGIMVDRMLRRMSSSLESNVPPPVSRVLKTLNEWNFEVFEMNTCSDNQALRYLGFELMQKFNLLSKFKIQNLVMQNFLEAMEAGYSKYNNPYHNLIHSTDVLQTTYHMLNSAGLMTWLTPLEILATFVSAIIHDYEHTGTTNNFHMQTRSELALTYNDRAVLENYHISATFRLLTNDTYNIVQELTREEYKEFRQLVIEMVLATDMSYHFTQLKTIKNMISLNETIEKPKALSLILHCADISHPSKKWSLHERWTYLLVDEYFAQGDKEKELGLPFSPLCDRNNTPLAQSQIGFISFIVEPSMTVLGDMIDRIFEQILSEEASRASKSDINDSISSQDSLKKKPIDRPWVAHLAENKAKWQSLAEIEKQKAAAVAAAAAALAATAAVNQESLDSIESTLDKSPSEETTSPQPTKSD